MTTWAVQWWPPHVHVWHEQFRLAPTGFARAVRREGRLVHDWGFPEWCRCGEARNLGGYWRPEDAIEDAIAERMFVNARGCPIDANGNELPLRNVE